MEFDFAINHDNWDSDECLYEYADEAMVLQCKFFRMIAKGLHISFVINDKNSALLYKRYNSIRNRDDTFKYLSQRLYNVKYNHNFHTDNNVLNKECRVIAPTNVAFYSLNIKNKITDYGTKILYNVKGDSVYYRHISSKEHDKEHKDWLSRLNLKQFNIYLGDYKFKSYNMRNMEILISKSNNSLAFLNNMKLLDESASLKNQVAKRIHEELFSNNRQIVYDSEPHNKYEEVKIGIIIHNRLNSIAISANDIIKMYTELGLINDRLSEKNIRLIKCDFIEAEIKYHSLDFGVIDDTLLSAYIDFLSVASDMGYEDANSAILNTFEEINNRRFRNTKSARN